jgi:hypothetical protein
VRNIDMPVTSSKVWEAIRSGGAPAGAGDEARRERPDP